MDFAFDMSALFDDRYALCQRAKQLVTDRAGGSRLVFSIPLSDYRQLFCGGGYSGLLGKHIQWPVYLLSRPDPRGEICRFLGMGSFRSNAYGSDFLPFGPDRECVSLEKRKIPC